MIVRVNGTDTELAPGTTLADLVAQVAPGERGRGVATAVDGEVVRRDGRAGVVLVEGAKVEIVTAVQGG